MSTSPSSSSIASSGTARASNQPCELLGVVESSVRDGRDRGAARAQVPRGLLAHLAGADEQDPAARQLAEDLLRERSGGGGTEAGLSPIAVSTRARRPAWSAWRKSRSSSGPAAPALERRAHLAEDLALARDERVEPCGDAEEMERGASSSSRYSTVRAPAPRPRRARAGTRSRARRVAHRRRWRDRARCGCTSRGTTASQPSRELVCEPAAASSPKATRSRSSTGARWCDTPTRTSLTMRSGSAGRTTSDDEREPRESRYARPAPAPPGLVAEHETRDAQRPSADRRPPSTRRSRRAWTRPRADDDADVTAAPARRRSSGRTSRSSVSSGGTRRRSTLASRRFSRRSCQR